MHVNLTGSQCNRFSKETSKTCKYVLNILVSERVLVSIRGPKKLFEFVERRYQIVGQRDMQVGCY